MVHLKRFRQVSYNTSLFHLLRSLGLKFIWYPGPHVQLRGTEKWFPQDHKYNKKLHSFSGKNEIYNIGVVISLYFFLILL